MSDLPPAYYLPLGGNRFEPTEATTSPWDTAAQHGGPPTALLATCLDDAFGRPDLRVARISMDFLGPVPRAEVLVETEMVRPGRRTQLSEASLWAGGRLVAVARVWHLATGPGPDGAVAHDDTGSASGSGTGPGTNGDQADVLPAGLPGPEPQKYLRSDVEWGYGRATEWRTVSGGFATFSGTADMWTRVRIPLVAGRPLDGLARFAVVADSANGISAPLPFTDWLFIPPGVTMHLHRYPVGEWVRMTATSDPGKDGIGLTEGTLSDAFGRCGIVTQPLLVAPRRWPGRRCLDPWQPRPKASARRCQPGAPARSVSREPPSGAPARRCQPGAPARRRQPEALRPKPSARRCQSAPETPAPGDLGLAGVLA